MTISVVITAMIGYLAALPFWDWVRTCYVMLGTALCAGGVAALNQWMESELDAKMKRTADRPIPAGVIQPGSDADVVVWDPDSARTITASDLTNPAGYSIFEGRHVTGRVTRSWLRGKPLVVDGSVRLPAGAGQRAPR